VRPLDDWIKRKGALPTPKAIGWVVRLCKRVEAFHQSHGPHGQISSRTMRIESLSPWDRGELILEPPTPDFAFYSPERIRGGPASQADDAWAIAMTLYVALTGHTPFAAKNEEQTRARVLAEPLPLLASFEVGDEALQKIVNVVLERDLSRRMVSVAPLRESLERWVQNPTIAALPPLEGKDPAPGAAGSVSASSRPRASMRVLESLSAGPSIPAAPRAPTLPAETGGADSDSSLAATAEFHAAAHYNLPAARPSAPTAASSAATAEPSPPSRVESNAASSTESNAGATVESTAGSTADSPRPASRKAPTAALLGALTLVVAVVAVVVGQHLLRAPDMQASSALSHASDPPSPAASQPASPTASVASPAVASVSASVSATVSATVSAAAAAASSPAPAASPAAPPAPASPAAGAPGDALACALRAFPPATFGDKPSSSLGFLCTETDPRRGGAAIKDAVIRESVSKRVSEGMTEWASLGWFEMAAFAAMRGRCCPGAAPLVLPVTRPCPPLDEPLNALAAAAAAGEKPTTPAVLAPVKRLNEAVRCVLRVGATGVYGRTRPPLFDADAALLKVLERVSSMPARR
jgi:hypothetical protein